MLPIEIQKEIKKIPELLSTIDFADEIGWDTRKVDTYCRRGIIPEPALRLRVGKLWTRSQVEWFKKEYFKKEQGGE